MNDEVVGQLTRCKLLYVGVGKFEKWGASLGTYYSRANTPINLTGTATRWPQVPYSTLQWATLYNLLTLSAVAICSLILNQTIKVLSLTINPRYWAGESILVTWPIFPFCTST